MIRAADAPAAGLAEPHALGLAAADGALHRVRGRRRAGVERRLDEGGERGAGAGEAEAAVPFAEGHGGGRLDGAVLGETGQLEPLDQVTLTRAQDSRLRVVGDVRGR